MSVTTPNLGLVKPGEFGTADIEIIDQNMQKLDDWAGEKETELSGKEPAFSKNSGFNMIKATDQTSLSDDEIASMALLQEIITFLKQYSDANTAGLVDAAPATLDTLNELARALDDNPNFATDVINLIATKLNANAQAVDSAKLGGMVKSTGVAANTIVQRDAGGNTIVNYITCNQGLVLNGYTIKVVV